jgi:choline-sulfatase
VSRKSRKEPPTTTPAPTAVGARDGRRWVRVALLVILAAGLIGAAGFAFRRRVVRSVTVHRDPGLSVLLVTIDTLRADALGSYGKEHARTPTLDRLAAGGVRFERCHAQNVVTLPSHANILSGRYPFDHGVRDNAGFRFPAGADTLATLLKARGFHTGAFVSAFPLDSRFGLDRGFDVYDDRLGDAERHGAFFLQERPGTATVAAARQWLEAQGPGPFFCWVHVYEPHFPYEPPEPFASAFPDAPYDGEVAAADGALAPLLAPILEAGSKGRTLVVLTADHGESLGDHGEKTHGLFAYEATLRVPLILYQPGLFGPRIVPEPVRHVDLLPTILDALALPFPANLRGRSLLPLAAGGPPPPAEAYFESISASLNRGWAPLHGVMQGHLKYIDLPIPELYDLAADPQETRNLIATEPRAAEGLRSLLGGLRTRDPEPRAQVESAETRERLRSLGYVASGTRHDHERYTVEDDPKRLIDLDRDLQALVGRYREGDLEGALAEGEAIVRRRPMPLILLHLAFLHREKGDLEAAVEAARTALLLGPHEADAASLLGTYLTEAGRPSEAVDVLRPFASGPEPDLDVLMALGTALAKSGRPREALDTFEKARSLDPSNATAFINIGTVHLMARDYAKARAAMEAALAIDPGLAQAHNHLGVIAAENHRPEEAIEHWKKAAALNPREWDTLFNLGVLLRKEGRREEARPYLQRFAENAPPAVYAADVVQVRRWLAEGNATRH